MLTNVAVQNSVFDFKGMVDLSEKMISEIQKMNAQMSISENEKWLDNMIFISNNKFLTNEQKVAALDKISQSLQQSLNFKHTDTNVLTTTNTYQRQGNQVNQTKVLRKDQRNSKPLHEIPRHGNGVLKASHEKPSNKEILKPLNEWPKLPAPKIKVKQQKKKIKVKQKDNGFGECVKSDCKNECGKKNNKITLQCNHTLHKECAAQIFINARRVPVKVLECPVCASPCSYKILKEIHYLKFVDVHKKSGLQKALDLKKEVLDNLMSGSNNLAEYISMFNDYRKTENYANFFTNERK